MIGQHTARALAARGHSLVVLHRASSDLKPLRDLQFEPREIDLAQPDKLKQQLSGLDGLIDCAGYYPTKPAPWKAEVRVARDQLNRVIDAAEAARVPRMVYLGAAIALPRRQDGKPGNEEGVYSERPGNAAPYVQVKWEMDRLARERSSASLPISIAIPSMCFGEYDRGPTTGRLIVDIANGKLSAYIRGQRNVIYAGDAGRGIALVLEKGRAGERYLLTGENLTMDELVPLIARVCEVKAPHKVAPLWLAKSLSFLQETRYRMFGGALPTLTSTAIAVLSSGQFLDGQKAKAELGFEHEVSVEAAIRRALTWFSAHGYVQANTQIKAEKSPVESANAP
jgi:nucleoside-diphosphate-sugar epimerase